MPGHAAEEVNKATARGHVWVGIVGWGHRGQVQGTWRERGSVPAGWWTDRGPPPPRHGVPVWDGVGSGARWERAQTWGHRGRVPGVGAVICVSHPIPPVHGQSIAPLFLSRFRPAARPHQG